METFGDVSAHSETLLRTLYSFYLEGKHCDVIILTTNDLIPPARNEPSTSAAEPAIRSNKTKRHWLPCHKLVLRANSPYFDEMFSVRVPGIQTPFRRLHLIMDKIRASSMQDIIQFCYTGSITVRHSTIVTLLEDANILQVDGLVQLCDKFIRQPISLANCMQVLRCSRNLGYSEVAEDSFGFLVDNFFNLAASPESKFYEDMTAEILEEVFQCEELLCDNEDDLLKILKNWISFDMEKRSQFQLQLFQHIRHGSLTPGALKDLTGIDSFMVPGTSRSLVLQAIYGEAPSFKRPSPSPGKVLVFSMSGKHEQLDSSSSKWTSLMQKPCMDGFGIAILRDCLYLIGHTSSEGKYETDVYNVRLNCWTKGPTLKKERWYFATCVSEKTNCIYVLGGSTDSTNLNSVEVLQCNESGQPSSGQNWRLIPAMTRARSRMAAAIVKDRVFVTGGYDGKDKVFSTVENYDVSNAEWTQCQSMTEKRRGHAMCAYDDKLFVFGGFSEGRSLLSAEKYDPDHDAWVQIASLRVARAYCGVTLFNKKMYIVGGRPAGISTEIYNPEHDKVFDGPSTNAILNYCKCVTWHDSVQKARSRRTSNSTAKSTQKPRSDGKHLNNLNDESVSIQEVFVDIEQQTNNKAEDLSYTLYQSAGQNDLEPGTSGDL